MNKQKNTYNGIYNGNFYDSEKKEYFYKYPHAALTADCVVFGFDGKNLKILLIERGIEPYKGMWALPGGFMKVADANGGSIDLTIEDTARRELREETNISGVFLKQFKVFSRFDRDPRERVVTVAFIALIGPHKYREVVEKTIAGDDASNAMWFNANALPPMAFDHADIIKEAKEYLSELIRIKPVAFNLLDDTFSMTELQNVYEAITGQIYDRRNFQRKALQTGLLAETKPFESVTDCDNCRSISALSLAPTCVEVNAEIGEIGEIEEIHRISPRKRKKFFSLKKTLGKNSNSNDSEEGSIKDIFNF